MPQQKHAGGIEHARRARQIEGGARVVDHFGVERDEARLHPRAVHARAFVVAHDSDAARRQAPGEIPAVVLVHRPGPNDRDETIGGHRPFPDLAWGPASRGIAVGRSDERTRVDGARMQSRFITLDAEVIDDARAALYLARSASVLDSARVFLLGHSLGAMLAPTIAARDGHLAGVILLAGPARRFADVLRDQIRYIDSLSVGADSGTKQILAPLPAFAAHTLPPDSVVLA